MGRKLFPFTHQSSSYKTFKLTSESREVGGGAGNLFVCLSLLETIINYGDCQSRTHWGLRTCWQIRLPGGGRGGGHQQYNYGQPALSCPVLGHNISILGNSANTPENIPGCGYCNVVTGAGLAGFRLCKLNVWLLSLFYDWHLHEKIWIIIFLL